MKWFAIPLVLLVIVMLVGTASADPLAKSAVPEPSGYWSGPMHSDTPATVKGAEVIDAQKLAEIKAKQAPVMIDVANMELKPKNFPSNMIWDPRHLSVPGATWMPGAGSGRTDSGFEDAFKARLLALTGGDKNKPIVTFCHPKRWGSWNAAKRAAALGYTHVYWMPSGAEGWEDTNEAAGVQADPSWRTSLSKLPPDPTGLKQQ